MSLTQLLQAYEPQLLNSLSLDDPTQLEESLHQGALIQQMVLKNKNAGALKISDATLTHQIAARVQMIASSLLNLEQDLNKYSENYQSNVDSYFNSQGSLAFSPSTSTRKSSSASQEKPDSAFPETLPSKQLRAWILENLSNPFPSRQDKEKLVKKTNLGEAGKATLAYNQVVLWFTNARRRCGWTSFFRKFAGSDKVHMQELLDLLAQEDSNAQKYNIARLLMEWKIPGAGNLLQAQGLAQECKDAYQVMIDWINDKHTQHVGEWMKEVEEVAEITKKAERESRKKRSRAVKEYSGMGDKRTPSTRKSSSSSNRNPSNDTSSSSRSISGNSTHSSALWSDSNRTYSTSSSVYSSNQGEHEREDSLSPPPPLSSENSPRNLNYSQDSSSAQPMARTKSPSAFIYKPTVRRQYSNVSNVRGDYPPSSSDSDESVTNQQFQLGPSAMSDYPPNFINSTSVPLLPPPNFTNQHFSNVRDYNPVSYSSHPQYASSPGSDGGYSIGALNSLQNSPVGGGESSSTPVPNMDRSDSQSTVMAGPSSRSKGKKRQIDEIEVEVDLNEYERDGNGKRAKNEDGGFDFDFQTDFSSLNSQEKNNGNGNGGELTGVVPNNWVAWNGQI